MTRGVGMVNKLCPYCGNSFTQMTLDETEERYVCEYCGHPFYEE
jgi:ribosomal protein S27AE